MSGAYVAKPALVVPLVIPPGWNPDWMFPGPSPPGYTPNYSLPITAPSSMSIGSTLEISVTLFDQDTYKTYQPDALSSIVWSATIDDSPVLLRFSGGDGYLASVTSTYSQTAGFWGAAPALDFQLTEEQGGKTLVLVAESTVRGQYVTDAKEITVGSSYRIEAKITNAEMTATGPGSATAEMYANAYSFPSLSPSGSAQYFVNSDGTEFGQDSHSDGVITTTSADSVACTISNFQGTGIIFIHVGVICEAYYYGGANSSAEATVTIEIKITNANTEEVVYSKIKSANALAISSPGEIVTDVDYVSAMFYPETENVVEL